MPEARTSRPGFERTNRPVKNPNTLEDTLLKVAADVFAGDLYPEQRLKQQASSLKQTTQTDPTFLRRSGALNSSKVESDLRSIERLAQICRDARTKCMVQELLAGGRCRMEYNRELGAQAHLLTGNDPRKWPSSVYRTKAYATYYREVIGLRHGYVDTVRESLKQLNQPGETRRLETAMQLPPRDALLPAVRGELARGNKRAIEPTGTKRLDTDVLARGPRSVSAPARSSVAPAAPSTASRSALKQVTLTNCSVGLVDLPGEYGGHTLKFSPHQQAFLLGSDVRRLPKGGVIVLNEEAGIRARDLGAAGIVLEFTKPGDFRIRHKSNGDRGPFETTQLTVPERSLEPQLRKLREAQRVATDGSWKALTSGVAGWTYSYSSRDNRLYCQSSKGTIQFLDPTDGSWHRTSSMRLPADLSGRSDPTTLSPKGAAPDSTTRGPNTPKPSRPAPETDARPRTAIAPAAPRGTPFDRGRPVEASTASRQAIRSYKIPVSSVVIITLPPEYGGQKISFAPSSHFYKLGSDVSKMPQNTTRVLHDAAGIRVRDHGQAGVIVEFTQPGTFILARKDVMERHNYLRYTLSIPQRSEAGEAKKLGEAKRSARDSWARLSSGDSAWEYRYSSRHDRLYARNPSGVLYFLDTDDGSWHRVAGTTSRK